MREQNSRSGKEKNISKNIHPKGSLLGGGGDYEQVKLNFSKTRSLNIYQRERTFDEKTTIRISNTLF